MKKAILYIMLILAALPLAAITVDEVPNVHVADRNQFVSNPDGVLSQAEVDRLNQKIQRIWDETSAEFVVVVVDRVDESMTPAQFAYEIQEKWGVGKKDKNNGLVLLVSRGDRRAEFVTGRGLEGVLPDVVCGRIVSDYMADYFREEDYDGGVEAGVDAVGKILTDPVAAEEIRSKAANDLPEPIDLGEIYTHVFPWIIVIMVLIAVFIFVATKRQDLPSRYTNLMTGMWILVALTIASAGAGLLVLLPYIFFMRRTRTKRRHCPNCGTKMKRLDEKSDNAYLTPAQDAEEQIGSVDYDVWLCPNCREVDVVPFINQAKNYETCPRCGARALQLVADRHIQMPTYRTMGIGEKVYHCRNCGFDDHRRYDIPRDDSGAGAAAAAAAIAGLSGMGGFGGGGFSGGSFGGGSSAGGGGGGGW